MNKCSDAMTKNQELLVKQLEHVSATAEAVKAAVQGS